MMSDDAAGIEFSPLPQFPQHPEFYRRVLEQWPSPVVVVDANGQVIYGNAAMVDLGGWSIDHGVGSNIVEYLHPDDVDELVSAFVEVAAADSAESFDRDLPWAAIHFRLITPDGGEVPVEVTGRGSLQDPIVRGIIYDVRPARTAELLNQVLIDVASGAPIDDLLALVMQMIAVPPLELQAATLQPVADGPTRVIGATDPDMHALLEGIDGPAPWDQLSYEPMATLVSDIPGDLGAMLAAAGYHEVWHVAAEADVNGDGHRIVALTKVRHTQPTGCINRLVRAGELAGVVLLRARSDALLDHSATHDQLTQLLNREGFYRELAASAEREPSTVAMYIDLDGFKPVNDEHGHAAGDAVLEIVASRLLSATRSLDLVARLGGDEFTVVLGSTADRPLDVTHAIDVAERIVHQIGQPIDIAGTTVSLSASVGVAVADAESVGQIDIEQLLARADAAMYEAKRAGNNEPYVVTA